MNIRPFLRFPMWLYVLYRLALIDGDAPTKPTIYDPIKELQDDLFFVSYLMERLSSNTLLSSIVLGLLRKRAEALAAEIIMLRNLNVAAAGFIPRDRS